MHYDEETGDMIDDDYSYGLTPCRLGDLPETTFGRRPAVRREKVSGILQYIVYAAACLLIGALIGMYSSQDKIEEWWKSFSANHISRGKSSAKEKAASPQEARLTVICWSCKAELDATHLKHLASFNGVCPCCNAQLHVESTGNNSVGEASRGE